jgi:hypothetical protein
VGDSPEEQGAKSDVDHGFGHIEAAFIVADQAPPANQPANDAFYDPRRGRAYDRRQLIDKAAFLNFIIEVIRRIVQPLQPHLREHHCKPQHRVLRGRDRWGAAITELVP